MPPSLRLNRRPRPFFTWPQFWSPFDVPQITPCRSARLILRRFQQPTQRSLTKSAFLAPVLPTTVECLVPSGELHVVMLMQAVAIEKDNPAQHPPVIELWHSMHSEQWESRRAICASVSQKRPLMPPLCSLNRQPRDAEELSTS